jgi:hypothetical protein
MFNYRPWGNIRWLMSKIDIVKKWTFCGCISAEDRCLAAYNELKKLNLIDKSFFSTVRDPESEFSNIINSQIEQYRSKITYKNNGININEFDLLYDNYTLIYEYIHEVINISKGNIVLDISCFPKRFFFPFIKFMFSNDKIHNLIITSTIPIKYKLGRLADNYAQWDTIPFFADLDEKKKKDIVLLGVGHMPMSSLEPIQDICASSRLQLLFPFPGHPQSFKLTWHFVFEIKRILQNKDDVIISHINAVDVSEVFDKLLTETDNGSASTLLAPYGPKPFSLAMAIFASRFQSPVYYTQPKLYYPNYSIGITQRNGVPSIIAYCLKLRGNQLY